MSDNAVSQDTGAMPAADVQPVAPQAAPDTFSDASEAARYLANLGHAKRKKPDESSADDPPQDEPAEPEFAGDEPADGEPDRAPADETTETQEAADDLPPIEPPRSWPKEDKDFFATLPRQAQDRIAQREQERDRAFNQRQNELAEQRRSQEAHVQQVEQLRQHYEAQLPLAVQTIQQSILNEFPDIKSQDDIQKLAANDPLRYVQLDAKLKALASWQAEATQAHQRQAQEAQSQLQNWTQSQDEVIDREFAKVPEPERKALAETAKDMLIEYGFSEDQVIGLWNGSILRSAPLQRIMADAARYRIAKRGAAKPAAKSVPPVQKPGSTAQPRAHALDAQIRALESKGDLTLKEADQLLTLKGQRRKASAA